MTRKTEIDKYNEAYSHDEYRMGEARKWAALRDLQSLRGGSLLDVGCGRGEVLELARDLGFEPVQGTEVVPALLGEGVRYAEAHELPFADGAFDHVTCFDVLEHLLPEDTEAALRELARVAAKTVTITVADYPHVFRGVDLHVNRRSYPEWAQLLMQVFGHSRARCLGMAGASQAWRITLEAQKRSPMKRLRRPEPARRADFEATLRGRHRGATFIVLGGGSSLAAQMAGAPPALRISANEHGCLWGPCDYVSAMDDIADKVRAFGIPVIGRDPNTCDYLAQPFPNVRWTGTQAVYHAYVMGAHLVLLAGMDLYQDLPEGTPGGRRTPLETHLEAWQVIKDTLPVPVRALGGPLVDVFGLYDPAEVVPAPGVLPRIEPVNTVETCLVRTLAGGALLGRRYVAGQRLWIRPDELRAAAAAGLVESLS
jgi:ubiquinone/menaquinone biosynthesis C-methylase UbiE